MLKMTQIKKNESTDYYTLLFEDAHIIFRNFSGRVSEFNREGRISFSIIIDNQEYVDFLSDNGWNVKPLRQREDSSYEEQQYHLPIYIRFDLEKYMPEIFSISRGVYTQYDEDMIHRFDGADIVHTDVHVRPYFWSTNGKEGVKAYVKELYVTVDEGVLARKYADMEYPEELPFD